MPPVHPPGRDAYNPVYRRESDAWHPTNEAADLLVHIAHIWEDIVRVNRVRDEIRDKLPDEATLLFKYILVEFRSLLDPLRRLQAVVMNADMLKKGKPAPFRYVTAKQLDEAKALFKDFWQGVRQKEADIITIRNTIGAHRGPQPWEQIESLWDRLDPAQFVTAMNKFVPLFKHLESLNLYNWSTTLPDGSLSIMGAQILHDYSEAVD